jgi:hypothetical protein
MNKKKFALAWIAFVIVGFIFTALWHLPLFGSIYEELYLITIPNPIFALGFLSFAIEGFAFVYIFERFKSGKSPVKEGAIFGILAYTLLIGSVAIIAHAAKHEVGNMLLWFGIEGTYFVIMGLVLGSLVGLICGKRGEK